MPYANIKELPEPVKSRYSEKAQEVFMAAFNNVMKQTNDEARAFAAAHSAAAKIDKMPPVKESEAIESDADFREASFRFDGVFNEAPTVGDDGVYKVPVTLIQPGLSKNKVYYSKKWLSEFAEAMEGKKAYLNHEKKSEIKDRQSRDVMDVAGWYTQVKQDTDGEVKGILNLVETPKTEHVIKIAKANPELVGLSINAKGKASRGKVDKADALIAETVERVYSTDIVTEAAAGGEMGAMRLVASVTMDMEEDDKPPDDNIKASSTEDEMDEKKLKEVEDELDETKKAGEWLVAETRYKADVASWLAAESGLQIAAVESTRRWLEVEKVPEKFRGYAAQMDLEAISKFAESLKNTPPEIKGNTPAGTPEPEKKPGEEGYVRKLL